MKSKKTVIFLTLLVLMAISCGDVQKDKQHLEVSRAIAAEEEKKAILNTLNDETKAAFQRDYDAWQQKWVHDPNSTKTYIDFQNNTFSESVGWQEISQFVQTFMEAHPEPEPVPKLVEKIEVRLYGNGAWVIDEQHDSLRGRKRETRLMEKVNGKWKIAGMQTTIYGFDTVEKELKKPLASTP